MATSLARFSYSSAISSLRPCKKRRNEDSENSTDDDRLAPKLYFDILSDANENTLRHTSSNPYAKNVIIDAKVYDSLYKVVGELGKLVSSKFTSIHEANGMYRTAENVVLAKTTDITHETLMHGGENFKGISFSDFRGTFFADYNMWKSVAERCSNLESFDLREKKKYEKSKSTAASSSRSTFALITWIMKPYRIVLPPIKDSLNTQRFGTWR